MQPAIARIHRSRDHCTLVERHAVADWPVVGVHSPARMLHRLASDSRPKLRTVATSEGAGRLTCWSNGFWFRRGSVEIYVNDSFIFFLAY